MPVSALFPCLFECMKNVLLIMCSFNCRFWQQIPIPHGCDAFQAICPYCAVPLEGEDGFVKLIFSTDE